MIEYDTIFLVSLVVGLYAVQTEATRRNLKNDLTEKINNAVARDAEERSKIYDKLCSLEKKLDRVILHD